MFITFEGLDSSGKSTQAKLLAARFDRDGYPNMLLRDPGGTAISDKVRAVLLDRENNAMSMKAELFLFCAARAQLMAEVIKPSLAKGTIVLSDRFYDSTTAYQGYGRGLDLAEINILNKIATDGTTPDLTLLIDVDMDELVLRRQRAGLSADRMESSGRTFFENVRRGYHAIAAQSPGRVILIDGMQSVEHIHERIWTLVTQRLAPVVR